MSHEASGVRIARDAGSAMSEIAFDPHGLEQFGAVVIFAPLGDLVALDHQHTDHRHLTGMALEDELVLALDEDGCLLYTSPSPRD